MRRLRPRRSVGEPRLAVYVDTVFRLEGGRVFTNSEAFPFMLFVAEVGRAFQTTTCVGRAVTTGAGTEFELPAGLRLAGLPYYQNLRRIGAVVGSIGGALRGMWGALDGVDVAWIFGPHPLALAFAALALIRRRGVVLGVRQDTMSYFRARLPGRGWVPLLGALWLIDRAFRLLSRFLPTVVVGARLERAYGGPREGLLRATISLTDSEEIVAAPPTGDRTGITNLLTVGRIEPEKNPLLLVDALAELDRRRPGEYRLTWAGTGRMAGMVEARAAERGITEYLDLAGFVPYGPELLAIYRGADIFVHVSLTEGAPQVIIEAMAAGVPVVATDVGSVRESLDNGEAGLIVSAGDRDALVEAVLELSDQDGRRRQYAERGLVLARRHARDVEAARVARFIGAPSLGAESQP